MTIPADRITREIVMSRVLWAIGFHQPEMYLIEGVKSSIVDFDYHGRHKELFKDITPADVVWASRLLSRLTDQQWNDAFGAAAYTEDVCRRYISKLKSKIQEGLALETRAATTP